MSVMLFARAVSKLVVTAVNEQKPSQRKMLKPIGLLEVDIE